MTRNIRNIVFDLGGVLIDWNPRYLYNKVFDQDMEKTEWFLNKVCTPNWNEQQDAGRSLAEGTRLLTEQFPQYGEWIGMYYDRWSEMFSGSIEGSVEILKTLKRKGQHNLYALTNWSAETFPWARQQYEFLQDFEGIVVSGEEKTKKPQEEIYHILIQRYQLDPHGSIFIDDNLENVEAARRIGLKGIHFQGALELKKQLKAFGIYTDL